jgi:hypothetical protein
MSSYSISLLRYLLPSLVQSSSSSLLNTRTHTVGQEYRSRASRSREGSGGEGGQRQSRRQEQDARIGRAKVLICRQKADRAEAGRQTQGRYRAQAQGRHRHSGQEQRRKRKQQHDTGRATGRRRRENMTQGEGQTAAGAERGAAKTHTDDSRQRTHIT